MKDSLNIAVAGATGYVGLELIKILSKHPRAKILYLCANKSAGKKIYAFDKKIINKNLPIISKIKNISWDKINVLFTALPNGHEHSGLDDHRPADRGRKPDRPCAARRAIAGSRACIR